MSGFAGKVAIVTGGATSIGAAIVGAFHAAGASVVIADIDGAAGMAFAAALGARVLFHRTDIGEDAEIATCVAATIARFAGIDILVNNACTFLDKGLES